MAGKEFKLGDLVEMKNPHPAGTIWKVVQKRISEWNARNAVLGYDITANLKKHEESCYRKA